MGSPVGDHHQESPSQFQNGWVVESPHRGGGGTVPHAPAQKSALYAAQVSALAVMRTDSAAAGRAAVCSTCYSLPSHVMSHARGCNAYAPGPAYTFCNWNIIRLNTL
jgi:hypothetical protein